MKKYTSCKICSGAVTVINQKYNLGQCKECNFIFCLNMYTQEEFITVYNELYNDENAIYQNHSITEFNNLLKGEKIKVGMNRSKLIKKNVFNSNCKSVLEIGSGIGLVASYIGQNDKTIQYTGIELDKDAFDKSQLLKLNTINGDFTEMDKLAGNFDVIMMWEVIEHLQDLKRFLELAYKKLNVGGKIILSTPNYNKIFNYPNREKDQLFQSLPPIHLNFFTLENIKNIFEQHQFKNCNSILKKWPYLELKQKSFYVNVVKSIFNKHQGTTIYFEASK
jgi:2-polyprenyl-3-methyl-5-hydroxy-6-metoxy-1,4-benzoquinol methylase